MDSDRLELLEPYTYVCGLQGKQMRSKIVNCFQEWIQVAPEVLDIIKDITDMLHSSSLLIDDIQDATCTRRSKPAAHIIFGDALTINAANYIYFEALQKVMELNSETALQVFTKEMLALHTGQGLEILWRDRVRCPTLEQYNYMIACKTGGLMRMMVGFMQALSGSTDSRIIELAEKLGVYYQIRDDYINLKSPSYWATRDEACDDIREGKFSYPVIVAISRNPTDNRLLEILRQKTSDMKVKRYAVEIIEETGAFEATLLEMDRLEVEINKLIADLGGSPGLSAVMTQLHQLFVEQIKD